MNEKEIAELRRGMKKERAAATSVKGCYINAEKTIIAAFEKSFGLLSEAESDRYFAFFRKGLSGTVGKNLIDVTFSNGAVEKGEEHALLTRLRKSRLEDAEALDSFFKKVAENVKSEDCYLLLLIYNEHDVPHRYKDGEKDETRFEVFSFIECVMCPVKSGKGALVYEPAEKTFVETSSQSTVAPARAGFLFPAFDGRTANIYGALYYTSDEKDSKEDFASAVFGEPELPPPAYEQREDFKSLLAESLEGECSFEVAKNLHLEVAQRVEEHKESREPETLRFDRAAVKEMLENSGVSEEKLEQFSKQFSDAFGAAAEIVPKNLDAVGKFEVRTPEIVVKVSKGSEHLIRREEVGGRDSLVIDAAGGVEINGMAVK